MMKLPQQLLLNLTALLEPPPPRTPATPPERAKGRPRMPATPKGEDAVLTETARRLVRGLRGHRELAEKVRVLWNPRLQTTAGTANVKTWVIEINPKLREHGGVVVQRILRHELAHLVSAFRHGRKRIDAHGPEWRQACADLGIPGESRCHNLPLKGRVVRPKFAYRCTHCGHLLKRVKPLHRRSACYECCKAHNGGAYDERFRYVRIHLENLHEGG